MSFRRSSMVLGFAFILVLCLGSAALGADPQLAPGARAMGMAGAFVAVADDGTAAYWNPAGITQLKVVSVTPSLAAGGDWTEFQTSVGDKFPPDLGNTELEINGMLGALFRGFGISALFEADARTSYEQSSGTTTSEGEVRARSTGLVTLARSFLGDVFALGVNLKGFYGQELSFEAANNESTPSASGGYYTESLGSGYGLDLGALFKVGDTLRVGAKVENLFASINWDDTEHTYDVTNGEWIKGSPVRRKEDLSSVLHLGLAVKPPVTGTLIAAQIDMPLGSEGETIYHIGLEQSLLVAKLRAGAILDSGFSAANYTAGLGFKLGPVVLDVAAVADPDFSFDAAVLTAGFTF